MQSEDSGQRRPLQLGRRRFIIEKTAYPKLTTCHTSLTVEIKFSRDDQEDRTVKRSRGTEGVRILDIESRFLIILI
jgi:hypothetical protein